MSEEEGICRPAFKIYGICKKKKKKEIPLIKVGTKLHF